MANFFDWLNKAFEGDSPEQDTAEIRTARKDIYQNTVTAVEPPIVVKSKLYTAENVHRDLTVKMLLFLTDIQQKIERKEIPAVVQNDSALLSEFGFSNAKNTQIANDIKKNIAAHNKAYEEKKSALAFMEEVWQKFGEEAMVVRYDHFFEILEKYDMVCGTFDRYTGTIPKEALDILSNLKGIWEKGEFSQKYGMAYIYASTFDYRNESSLVHLRKRMRMPFTVADESVMEQLRKLTFIQALSTYNASLGSINDALFIAAPAADMKPLPIKITFSAAEKAGEDAVAAERSISPKSVRYSWQREYTSSHAIRKEKERLQAIIEESDIPRYCKCDFIKTQPLPERKVYDPFICSLTHYGVLIHAKWGAEAEDATIKRYEQLRDAIIGKGGIA